jgi:hypothetical protein
VWCRRLVKHVCLDWAMEQASNIHNSASVRPKHSPSVVPWYQCISRCYCSAYYIPPLHLSCIITLLQYTQHTLFILLSHAYTMFTRKYIENIYMSARISSKAFSPIINVGRLGNSPGCTGKTEPSTTQRLSTPRTRNLESRTASGPSSEPIAQLPVTWCE